MLKNLKNKKHEQFVTVKGKDLCDTNSGKFFPNWFALKLFCVITQNCSEFSQKIGLSKTVGSYCKENNKELQCTIVAINFSKNSIGEEICGFMTMH